MKAALRRVLLAGLLMWLAASSPMPVQAKATDSGAWAPPPNLLEGHVAHTATLLNDGRVLIAGGTHVDGVARARCELFDPRRNRWTRAADMIHARAAHAATLLADGNVLVTGGQTGLSLFDHRVLASAEIYHPKTHSWTPAPAIHTPRRLDTSMRLHDRRLLVLGGTNLAPGSPLPAAEQEQAELYDPPPDRWSFARAGLAPLSRG